MAGTFISWIYLDDDEYRRQAVERTPEPERRRPSRDAATTQGRPRPDKNGPTMGMTGARLRDLADSVSDSTAVRGSGRVQRIAGRTSPRSTTGYEANPDGTYSLWFGYLNRNLEEHSRSRLAPITVSSRVPPIAASRRISCRHGRSRRSGGRSQGLRQAEADLAARLHGRSRKAWSPARSALDHRSPKTTIEGTVGENLAPDVSVAPPVRRSWCQHETATFTVSATDDGLPIGSRTKKPVGLRVRWRKYRGPSAACHLHAARAARRRQDHDDRRVSSEPGEYVLQAVVDDGSLLAGTYCCWVSQEVKITVK